MFNIDNYRMREEKLDMFDGNCYINDRIKTETKLADIAQDIYARLQITIKDYMYIHIS